MRNRTAIALLVLVAAALYFPAVSAPFAYDDYAHFLWNQKILHPQSISDIFRNGLQETRPVYNLSLAAQAFLFGTNAIAAHVVNLALFFSCGVLLFFLLLRLTENSTLTMICTLVFLVHPMAVETVVYFNSRSGLLGMFFSLAALLCVTYRKFPGCLIFLALAIGSKEDAEWQYL